MADPRSARTRAALAAAILRLAARKPVIEVGVAELCREAGISRDTFYRHAENPLSLLADALAEELKEVLGENSAITTVSMGERVLLTHIKRHAAVYRNALSPTLSGLVRHNLECFLRDGLLQWAAEHTLDLPPALAGDERALRVAASYAAAGTVGAIEEWLRWSDLDVEAGTELILASSPTWWRS